MSKSHGTQPRTHTVSRSWQLPLLPLITRLDLPSEVLLVIFLPLILGADS